MKKFLFVLIIIFICGILSADICLKQMQESDVLVGVDFYNQYANAKLVFKDVFWNVLYERIKLYFVLIILCFTPIKKKVGFLLVPLFCFIWGYYIMSCIIELGIAGIVVGLASVLPHGILYAASIGMIIVHRKNSYYRKNKISIEAGLYIIIILTFITGCVIESIIGIHFIPWVIRLSMI